MTEASLLVSQGGPDTLRRAYETISRKVGDLDFAIPEVIIYKGGSTLEMPLSPEQIYEKIVLNHFNYELREAGFVELRDLRDLFKTERLVDVLDAVAFDVPGLIVAPKLPSDHSANFSLLVKQMKERRVRWSGRKSSSAAGRAESQGTSRATFLGRKVDRVRSSPFGSCFLQP